MNLVCYICGEKGTKATMVYSKFTKKAYCRGEKDCYARFDVIKKEGDRLYERARGTA